MYVPVPVWNVNMVCVTVYAVCVCENVCARVCACVCVCVYVCRYVCVAMAQTTLSPVSVLRKISFSSS